MITGLRAGSVATGITGMTLLGVQERGAEVTGDLVPAATVSGYGRGDQVAEGDQPAEQDRGDADPQAKPERVECEQASDDRRAERVERRGEGGVHGLQGVRPQKGFVSSA